MAEIQQLKDMGFGAAEAEVALRETSGNVEQALELLLTGALPTSPDAKDRKDAAVSPKKSPDSEWPELPKRPAAPTPSSPSGYGKSDAKPPGLEDEAALGLSLEENVPTPQMPRPAGLPCGLLNVGNTCYVNSLLQTLFHAEEFRNQVLHFKYESKSDDMTETSGDATETSPSHSLAAKRRQRHAVQLVLELRRLFGYCLYSERSCVSPSQLIAELVDQHGHKLPMGGQEDVSEFMLKFVDQLEEGFSQNIKEEADKETNALHDLLFGEQVQIFSYRESGDGKEAPEPAVDKMESEKTSIEKKSELIVSEECSDFLQIFLDVKYKNLYSAWAASSQQDVDYTTPAGSKAAGKTRVWIRRLPKLLFFQLQRVAFDPETKEQVKLEDEFDFELSIYPDRFLQRNEEEVLKVEAKVELLRRELSKLEKALESFQQYRAEGTEGEAPLIPVVRLLHGAANCLESNIRAATSSPEIGTQSVDLGPGNVVNNSDLQELRCELQNAMKEGANTDGDESSVKGALPAVSLLRSLAEACGRQEEQLQSEKLRIEKELSEAYNGIGQSEYQLFGIWVHQGNDARSGHYLAFLKDREDRWMRFSDSFVSFVPWEEVKCAAIGASEDRKSGASKSSSAYVLVYMESSLARAQAEAGEKDPAISASALFEEIQADNKVLQTERGTWEEQVKARELRQHAQAIFQAYAGLLHRWEPRKQMGDAAGNPHDPNHRKMLNDPALVCLELYLYRYGGEQDVWHYLLYRVGKARAPKCNQEDVWDEGSLDEQREIRNWRPEDEGRILFFLAETLRSQSCSVKMLQEKSNEEASPSAEGAGDKDAETSSRCKEYELIHISPSELHERYKRVLIQAYMLDEALSLLKKEGGLALPRATGLLSLLWGHYNLDIDYRFRHNEVLLVLSSLMYNTVSYIEEQSNPRHHFFGELCEYFYIVLHCVEWPRGWKAPLQNRIKAMFPQCQERLDTELANILKARAQREGASGVTPTTTIADQKQLVRQRSLLYTDGKTVEDFQDHPAAGEAFHEKHRSLWSWTMTNEKVLAQDFVTLTVTLAGATD